MLKKMQLIAVAVLGVGHAGVSIATGPAHPDNSEAGTVYHGPEYKRIEGKLARADTWNVSPRPASAQPAPRAADNWEFIGGESLWQLRQPRYDLRGNRLGRDDNEASPLRPGRPALRE